MLYAIAMGQIKMFDRILPTMERMKLQTLIDCVKYYSLRTTEFAKRNHVIRLNFQ